MSDDLQASWQRLVEHCYANGLGDVLMAVRQGYADELNSERRARHAAVVEVERVAARLAVERAELAADVERLRGVLGDIAEYAHKTWEVRKWCQEALAPTQTKDKAA